MERVVDCRRDPYDVYVGRGRGEASKWGNPFRIGDPHPHTGAPIRRGEAIELYKEWIVRGEGRRLLKDLGELEGKVLGCWCAKKGGVGAHDPLVCHGQILLLLVEHRRKKLAERRARTPGVPEAPETEAREAEAHGAPQRYIFFGSRNWNETTPIKERLARLPEDAVIVVGGARGADRIAEQVARRMGFRVEVYPARWDEEGKGAGYRRNERMRDLPGVKVAFGFRTPGRSNGIDHMAGICKEAGIQTTVQLPARRSIVAV